MSLIDSRYHTLKKKKNRLVPRHGQLRFSVFPGVEEREIMWKTAKWLLFLLALFREAVWEYLGW